VCLRPILVVVASILLSALPVSGARAEGGLPPSLGVDVGPRDPGCAFLLRVGGRTRLAGARGVREAGGTAALDTRTNFRLASLSKQFTAMAIMLLVADGRLTYETTLAELFPGFPAYAGAITVRHLLTHTAGLPDYEDAMQAQERAGGPRYTPARQIHDAEVLALLQRAAAPEFAPGERWAYSNSAYVLLGLAVERVSGMDFGEFLARRVFIPLGMRSTLVYVRGRNRVPHRAYGHEPAAGRLLRADQSSTSATRGDGGIYSNLEDLARWDAALAAHTLLPQAAMQAAYEPVRLVDGSGPRWPMRPDDEDNLAPGEPVAYGFGWFLDPLDGAARQWHFGTTRGFHSAIMRFPVRGVTSIVLCNRSDVDARAVAAALARQALVPGR